MITASHLIRVLSLDFLPMFGGHLGLWYLGLYTHTAPVVAMLLPSTPAVVPPTVLLLKESAAALLIVSGVEGLHGGGSQ